ncbi:MAG: tetratricopeptide repeat protein [Candidatus Kapabacteria bacterium]|nr:tetratricopeptide repeat protein [Candidatus Kapabacteria bacterium]
MAQKHYKKSSQENSKKIIQKSSSKVGSESDINISTIQNSKSVKAAVNPKKIIWISILALAVIIYSLLLVDWGVKVVDPWYAAALLVDSSRKVTDPALKASLLEEGGDKLRVLAKDFPSHARVHFLLGFYYLNSAKWDSAIPEYRQAIKMDSGSTINSVWPQAQQHLSVVIQNKTNEFAASNHFQDIIKLMDSLKSAMFNDPEFEYRFGVIYHQLNQQDSAFVHYQQALKYNPNYSNPDLFSNLGLIYLNRHQFKEAINALSRSLALNPKNKNAIGIMINAQQLAGNISEADKYRKMLAGL